MAMSTITLTNKQMLETVAALNARRDELKEMLENIEKSRTSRKKVVLLAIKREDLNTVESALKVFYDRWAS